MKEFPHLVIFLFALILISSCPASQKAIQEFGDESPPSAPEELSEPTSDSNLTSECTTNAGCGYKQRCVSGKCETVQCTTDAQCTGCRRCSNYQCVRCGYGASGYCTC